MKLGFDLEALLSQSCAQWGIAARVESGSDGVEVHAGALTIRVSRIVSAEGKRPGWVLRAPSGQVWEARAVPGVLLRLRGLLEPKFEPGRALVGARYVAEGSQ